MARRYQKIAVTGVANSLTMDDGLESTEQERIHVLAVHVSTSAVEGNTVEGYVRQTQEIEVPDELLDTTEADGTNQYRSTGKLRSLPLDRELAVGEKLQVGIRCGGTTSNLFGAYEYELM